MPSCSLIAKICIALTAAVVLSEAGAWAFRAIPPGRGAGPVYSWSAGPNAVSVEDRNTELARDQYKADRGGQWKLQAGQSLPVTVYYFEWDRLETAPTMIIDGHHAELCNEIAGFRLVERLPPRRIEGPDGTAVEFDATWFVDPAGRPLYSFKNVWLAETGNWDTRQKSRMLRLHLAFVRRQDPARVLQAGVFDAKSADEAWQTFRARIVPGISWSRSVGH